MAKSAIDTVKKRIRRGKTASAEPRDVDVAPPDDRRDAGLAAASLAVGQPAPRPDGQRRTGIVWVHGIGTQQPGESLFDWTHPVLDVMAEWRRDRDDAEPGLALGENPVAITVM